jgi:hypothetical protein
MTTTLSKHELLARNEIVAAPAPRACTDRDFHIPVALHAGYFGLILAYLGVMWLGFSSPGLLIPMAICVIFTAAFYIVPMKWATMQPANPGKSMSMTSLMERGVDTINGRCSGGAAIAQVLVLPVLLLFWGIAVVTIAALV